MNSRFLIVPAALVISHSAQALIYLSVEQAQALMFPGQVFTSLPIALSASDIAAIEKDCAVRVFAGTLAAWKTDSGYFFTDSVIGKHDLIRYAVAMDKDGKIREVEILEYREAYGGEVRNSRWLRQFAGLHHGDTVKVGRGIQNISGATLSSEHLTDGIRRLLATYAVAIAGK